jgi:ABC-type amino acid transport substrate-binding protein
MLQRFSWLLLASIAVFGGSPAAAQDLARVQKAGKLVMLAFPHQQNPFIRVNLAKGAMVKAGSPEFFEGFDVDLMAGFARRLNVELEILPVSEPRYAALIPDLLAGRGDLIASSLTITEERRRHVAFSRPYFRAWPVIVTREDNEDIRGLADLKYRVGAIAAGSSHEERLLKMGVASETLRRYDFAIETYGAVSDHQAEYLMADSSSAATVLKEEPGLKIAFSLPEEHFFGVAVRPGSDLLPVLDEYLLAIEKSGELAKLRERYFGDLLN